MCVLVLALTPLLAFLPAFTQSSIPLNLHSVFFAPPWEEARPAGLAPAENSTAAMQALRTYPSRMFLHSSVAQGDSLLWRPSEGLGAPFFALWRTRCLSPFSLPLYFMGLDRAIVAGILLKLLIAGWCAFYAARRLAFPPAMALFVGLAFQMSGPIYMWSGYALSDVTPWLPLLLVCAERLVLGQFRAWALTAVTVALMGLGGDPETLAGALLFALVYIVVRRLRDSSHTHLGMAAAGWALGVLGGLALIAVQLVPYLEYLTQAATSVLRPHLLLSPRDLLVFLDPGLLDPARADAASAIRVLHVGVVQVMLLALWIALRRFLSRPLRRRMEALFLSAAGMTLLAFLAVPVLSGLPWLGRLEPQHYLIALPLAFAFVAAASLEEWNELNPEQCKAALARLAILIPVIWGGALVAVILYGAVGPADTSVWRAVFWMLLSAVAIMTMLGVTLFRPNVRVTGYVFCLLVFVAQWAAFAPHVSYTARADIFPATGMIRSLQSMDTRIGGSDTLKQWPLSGNGIAQVFAPGGAVLARYEQFMDRAEEDPLLLRRTGARALLLTKEDIQGAYAAVRPVLSLQEVYPSGAVLFRDLETTSRARMVYAVRSVDNLTPNILSSEEPPLLEGATLTANADSTPAVPSIEKPESNGRVVVNVPQTARGLLVLADSWYPGWEATVNGQPAKVLPVDTLFRGVEVGEGEHQVVFEYKPFSLKLGIAISLLALLIVGANLRHFLPRRRNSSEWTF